MILGRLGSFWGGLSGSVFPFDFVGPFQHDAAHE